MKQEIPIISIDQTFYKEDVKKIIDWEIAANNTLDLPAIASFIALGFMLDQDTYYNEIKTVRPAIRFDLDDNNCIIQQKYKNTKTQKNGPYWVHFLSPISGFPRLFLDAP